MEGLCVSRANCKFSFDDARRHCPRAHVTHTTPGREPTPAVATGGGVCQPTAPRVERIFFAKITSVEFQIAWLISARCKNSGLRFPTRNRVCGPSVSTDKAKAPARAALLARVALCRAPSPPAIRHRGDTRRRTPAAQAHRPRVSGVCEQTRARRPGACPAVWWPGVAEPTSTLWARMHAEPLPRGRMLGNAHRAPSLAARRAAQ